MPFDRPQLSQIKQRINTDIESRLDTGKLLSRSLLNVQATAYAGAVHGLHGHLQWNFRQLFPDTADAENLARWASIWGISRKAAAFASGDVTFTGNESTSIPQGTIVKRGDGAKFSTDSSATISGGTATVSVTALDAGTEANTDAGVRLTLEQAISGIDSEAEIDSGGITGGADEESDTLLRERVLARIQQPPHGGAEFDYKFWARQVKNVTRAFVIPKWNGLGTVAVYVVDDDGANAPIPDQTTVDEAQTFIDEQRPVTADVSVFAPTAKTLDFDISVTPDTAEVRQRVEDNLKDLLKRDAEVGGPILISRIREAVSQAAGESDNTVNAPTSDVTTASGEIAVFGSITWT